jgi:hypothetical protein
MDIFLSWPAGVAAARISIEQPATIAVNRQNNSGVGETLAGSPLAESLILFPPGSIVGQRLHDSAVQFNVRQAASLSAGASLASSALEGFEPGGSTHSPLISE